MPMTQAEIWRKKFEELQVCVIIPTYNNDKTLAGVIEDVADYTGNIIVVNDGSTDQTLSILQGRPFIACISYERNRGKGWALRKGLDYARELGYAYAISFDSDGQHYGDDLPGFIQALPSQPASILVGARNMEQGAVPGKSSFGMRFSNFWFRLETGISCPDTQSGLRLYPLYPIRDMRFFTRKYEFEIEILVRSAWRGIGIGSVPVKVYYARGKDRISHFRPWRDFARISALNAILVIISFIYIRPRDFLLSLSRKEGWRKQVREQFFNSQETDFQKAASVSFGIFMGIIPIWGFQLALAIILAILFKLNKALVIIAANISIPPMIPLIIYLSYKTGSFWMHGKSVEVPWSGRIGYQARFIHLEQYLYGSITLAILSGAAAGLTTFALLKFFNRKKDPVKG
jgi:glycosyltransferase involved in cell wall biosynthesis